MMSEAVVAGPLEQSSLCAELDSPLIGTFGRNELPVLCPDALLHAT